MSNQAHNVRMITTALLLGLILSSIDQTIVSTAMPSVSKELGGLSLYSWVFAIYMLASTTSMPIYGKMADLFGRKKMYLIGLFFFLAGSLLCGFAQTMTELIIYRGIQGLGAGALMPIAFTIIADVYPPEKIGKFQGLFSAVFAVSSVLGPAIGGMIVEQWDWGWIFFINLPIGIPAFLLLAVSLTEKKAPAKRSIDWLGAATLSGTVICLLLAMVLAGGEQPVGSASEWQSPRTIGLLGASIILLTLFLWIETKAKEPILPLHLFKLPAIAFGSIAGFFVSAALFSAIAYLPFIVQSEMGMSPSQAGYLLSPLMLATVVTSQIGGRLMSKVTYRTLLIPSLAVMALGFCLLQQMDSATTTYAIVLNLIVIGLGMGAIYPALGTAAVQAVEPVNRGVAASSSQFFRSIGGTIGVSVMGSLLGQSYRAVFFAGLIFVCVSLLASFFLGKARLIPKPIPGQDTSRFSGR